MSTSTPIIIKAPNSLVERAMFETMEQYKEELKVKVDALTMSILNDDECNSTDEYYDRTSEQLQQISNILKRGHEHVEERLLKRRCLDKKEAKEEEQDAEKEEEQDTEKEEEKDDEEEDTSTSPRYAPSSPNYSPTSPSYSPDSP
jgi:hypothetical protein